MSAEAPRPGANSTDGGLPPTGEKKEGRFAGKIAVIPGSRDLGGALARAFAAEGGIVITSFRINRKRSVPFKEEMEAMDATFELVEEVDITTDEGIQKLVDATARHQGNRNPEQGMVDFLFLNPAGPDEKVNVEAQDKLLQAFVPLMASGSVVVEEQSVPGEYYPVIKDTGLIPPDYKPAESKYQGQRQRRENWLPVLKEKGIKMLTLIIPAVEDTWMAQTINRADKQAAAKNAAYSAMLGLRPSILSSEVAAKTLDRLAAGISDDDLEMFGPHLDGRHTLKDVYGEEAILVDTFDRETQTGRTIITPNRLAREVFRHNLIEFTSPSTAVASVQINAEHSLGHLKDYPVFPAHKQIGLAVNTMGEILGNLNGRHTPVRLKAFDSAEFSKPIKPGDNIKIAISETQRKEGYLLGKTTISVDGETAAVISGLLVESIEDRESNEFLEDQIIEAAAQSTALDIFASRPGTMPLFQSIGPTDFYSARLKVGDVLVSQREKAEESRRELSGSALVTTGDGTEVARIRDMKAILASERLARRYLGYDSQE